MNILNRIYPEVTVSLFSPQIYWDLIYIILQDFFYNTINLDVTDYRSGYRS